MILCLIRLVIADELDYLITRDRAVLHDLFMLTTLPYSRCILIGIIYRKMDDETLREYGLTFPRRECFHAYLFLFLFCLQE